MTTNNQPNRLANEKSPYLLQHAYNPSIGSLGQVRRSPKRSTKTNPFSSASAIRLAIGIVSVREQLTVERVKSRFI